MRVRPVMWMIILAGISLGISGILAVFAPLPQPQFHDEFSYLLAADTFWRGRLTNPPHKLWKFFETFQVIQQPTYQSKYQPGHGMVLALGQLLAHPIVGIWLTTAVATAAAYWCMRGYVARRLALLGAAIVLMHPLVLRWNCSYWGGTLPMLGGFLVVGAIGRLRITARASVGLMLGLGVSILLLTRPFEGMIATAASFGLVRGRRRAGNAWPSLAVASAVISLTLMFQLYYNFRVTHSAWTLPYQVYESTYATNPPFIWLPRPGRAAAYDNAQMRDYYLRWELPQYQRQHSLAGLAEALGQKAWNWAKAYLESIGLVIPILAIPCFWMRDRTLRRATIAAGLFTAIVLGNLWFFPHYAAAGAGLYLLVVVSALRHLKRWLVVLVVVLQIISGAGWVAGHVHRGADGWSFQRAALIEQLRQSGGKHLVVVRYPPDAYTHNEWVYNSADIDGSPVVWARDRGEVENRELQEYFPDRETWLLEVGVRFVPYK